MPSSPIRKLVPFAERAQANGIKVYHLSLVLMPAAILAMKLLSLNHFTPITMDLQLLPM
jgi:hypothetical protein